MKLTHKSYTGRLASDPLGVMTVPEVEFATGDSEVAFVNGGAAPEQEIGGDAFSEPAELPRGQRAEVGSSSSMLTSRNVITLTLLTNLAGRYMSHTHASFNSSSK